MDFPIKFDTVKSEWSIVETASKAIFCDNIAIHLPYLTIYHNTLLTDCCTALVCKQGKL